jgi:predicted hydrocarbon binding protein
MEQEKTVTNLAMRSAYETVSEVVGENARDMIFKKVGLTRILESPPEYNWDKEFTNEEHISIYAEVIDLVGAVGAQGILRLIGYRAVENPVTRFGILDHLKDLPKEERIAKGFDLLRVAINRGRVVNGTNGLPQFDVADCLICDGRTSRKPYCSNYSGSLQFITDWVYGKGIYLVREVKCKALGDDTCLFEIEEKGS